MKMARKPRFTAEVPDEIDLYGIDQLRAEMRVINMPQPEGGRSWRVVGLGIVLSAALGGCSVAPARGSSAPYSSGVGPKADGDRGY
jgi:hypothetical protein